MKQNVLTIAFILVLVIICSGTVSAINPNEINPGLLNITSNINMGELANFVNYYSIETYGSQTQIGILSEIGYYINMINGLNNSAASTLNLPSQEYASDIDNFNQIKGLLKTLIP